MKEYFELRVWGPFHIRAISKTTRIFVENFIGIPKFVDSFMNRFLEADDLKLFRKTRYVVITNNGLKSLHLSLRSARFGS